jgi:hypothetical protein
MIPDSEFLSGCSFWISFIYIKSVVGIKTTSNISQMACLKVFSLFNQQQILRQTKTWGDRSSQV